MKLKFKILAALFTTFILMSPAVAFAFNPYGGVSCNGASNSTVCAQASQPTGNPLFGHGSLLGKATVFIAFIGGIAAIIILIIGGIRYASSAGSPEKANGAKRTIAYALIGLVIIALAEFIVNFVISNG